ncbi:MAG: hypothetical protein GX161_05175 [Firmicutes bacterium]|jgi:hypothetical protein|nr:hypothetical protein [Bacillota bacterium]
MAFGWIGKVIGTEFGRAGRSIVQAVRLFYDYMGLSVLVSVFWYGLGFLPVQFFVELTRVVAQRVQEEPQLVGSMVIAGLTVALVTILWAAPVTASAYAAVYSLITQEGFYVRDLFLGIGRYYKKAVATSAIAFVVLAVLLANLWFYINNPSAVLRWISILFLYLIAFWIMGIQYLFPFVVQQDVGVLKTLQRTALVALDNVIVSFLLTLAGAVFLVVCLIPLVPMVLLYMGFTAALHNFALREILKKYDDPPPGAAV